MNFTKFLKSAMRCSVIAPVLLLSACSGGGTVIGSGSGGGTYNLVVDNTSPVPLVNGSSQNFYVYVKNVGTAPANNLSWDVGNLSTNNSTKKINSWWSKVKNTLKLSEHSKLQANGDTITIVDASNCSSIAAGASCRILMMASNPASVTLQSNSSSSGNNITQNIVSAYGYTPSYSTAADTLTLSPLSPISYADGYSGYSFFILNNSNNSIALDSAPFGTLPSGMNYSLLAGQSCANPMPAHTACQVRMTFTSSDSGSGTTSAVSLTPSGTVVGGDALPTQGTTILTTTDQKVGIPNMATPAMIVDANSESTVTTTAYISNTGSAILTVGNLSSSSTVATIGSDGCSGKSLNPGEICSYQISVDPAKVAGNGSAAITVPYNNGINSGTTSTTLNWNYVSVVTPNPGITLNNGGNLSQSSLSSSIVIQNSGNVVLRDLGTPALTTSSSHVALSNGNCTGELAVGKSCYYTLTYTPAAPSENTTATISGITAKYVDSSGNTQSITFPATTAVNVTSTFQGFLATGGDFSLSGTTPSKTVTISNSGTTTATIKNIAVSGNNLTVNGGRCTNKALAPNTSCTLTVSLTNSTTAGSGNGTLDITYDNHNGNASIVATSNVSWLVGEAASLNVNFSQSNLFAIVGSESTIEVTLTNNGNTPLTAIHLPTTSAPLSWTTSATGLDCKLDGTQSLQANEYCNLVLKYAPTVSNTAGTVVTLGKFTATTGQSSAYSTGNYSVTETALRQNSLSFDNGATTSIFQSANWTNQSSATTITVKNINSSPITINSTPITGVNATASGCSGALASGNACTLIVAGNYSASGSGILTVNYTDTEGNRSQTLPITVTYQTQPVVTPNLGISKNPSGTITLFNGGLVVAPVTLTLTNTTTVQNPINTSNDGTLKIKASSLVPNSADGVNYTGVTGTCVVGGDGYIALSNQSGSNSCTYIVSVSSTAAHGAQLSASATSQYQYQTYTDPTTVSYGTDQSGATISIDTITQSASGLLSTPTLVDPNQINAFNGVEQGTGIPTVSFRVTNVGATAISSVIAPSIPGFTFDMSACNNLAAYSGSCTFTATLDTANAIPSGNLNNYSLSYGSGQTTNLPNMVYSVVTPNSPVITASVSVANCQQGSGFGSNTCLINTGNPSPVVTINLINTGSGTANNFTIPQATLAALAASLGSGYSGGLAATNCSNATLANGNACTITFNPSSQTATSGETLYDLPPFVIDYSYQYGSSSQLSDNGAITTPAIDVSVASPLLTIGNIADVNPGSTTSTTVTLSNWYGSSLPALPTYSFTGAMASELLIASACSSWTAAAYGGTCDVTISASNQAAAGTANLNASISSPSLSQTQVFNIVIPVKKYIFYSSRTVNGDLQHGGGYISQNASNGFTGADQICTTIANSGSKTKQLSSNWKALLYSNNATVSGTIYLNTNDQVVATATGGDLVGSAAIQNSLQYNENGYILGANVNVWTGAPPYADKSCNSWTSNSYQYYGSSGLASAITSEWWWNTLDPASGLAYNCGYRSHTLYCVQQ